MCIKLKNTQELGEQNDVYWVIYCVYLSDCKGNFRIKIHGRFEIDLLSVETLPSFSLKDALKSRTRIELELLTDINMILCYEKSIRGVLT